MMLTHALFTALGFARRRLHSSYSMLIIEFFGSLHVVIVKGIDASSSFLCQITKLQIAYVSIPILV